MLRRSMLVALLVLSGHVADADAQPIRDARRGELLYSTHCLACHNTQVHWREKKLATDWASLQAEVRRWALLSKLEWSAYDVEVVTGYLNDLHYRYPLPD
jgi:mono/diheme cytochrome c family protein